MATRPTTSELPALRLARLVSRGAPVNIGVRGAISARVACADGDRITAYVKRVEGRELAAEIVCALLGRQIGLPVPEPLLVYIPARFGGPAVAAGSVALPYPNLATCLDASDPIVEERLLQWKQLVPAACFDEWIVNVDRNLQNLLFDGVGFYLIDHGRALAANADQAGPNPTNYLLDTAREFATDLMSLKVQMLGVMQAFATQPVWPAQLQVTTSAPRQFLSPIEVVSFLLERQTHLHRLASTAIVLPQHGLFDA